MLCRECLGPCADEVREVDGRTFRRTQCRASECSNPTVLAWIDVTDADSNGVIG